MLRLIFRLSVVVPVGAAALIVTAFGVGALTRADTILYHSGDGFGVYDMARGVSYVRGFGFNSPFPYAAFDDTYTQFAALYQEQTDQIALRVYDLATADLRCTELLPGSSIYLYSMYWRDDHTLLLNGGGSESLGFHRLDVPGCTLEQVAEYTGRLESSPNLIQPSPVMVLGDGVTANVYQFDWETGELRQLNDAPLSDAAPYAQMRYVPLSRFEGEYDPRYILYGDRDELHVYDTSTHTRQTTDGISGMAQWVGGRYVHITRSFSDNNGVAPLEIRSFDAGVLSEPLLRESAVFTLTNAPSGWSPDDSTFAYVRVADPDALAISNLVDTHAVLFDAQTGVTTRLLPDQNRVEWVGWTPDGRGLLITPRAATTPTLLYDLAAGEAQSLGLRLEPFDFTWAEDGTLIYVDASNALIQRDLSNGTQRTLTQFDAAETLNWPAIYRGHLWVNVSRGTQQCLYLFDATTWVRHRPFCMDANSPFLYYRTIPG
jgi:hypothetical protein